MPNYIIEDGAKKLQLDDGSKVPVVAPLSLDNGSTVKLISEQETLLEGIQEGIADLNAVQAGPLARLLNAPDLVQTFVWLDAGTTDQRLSSVSYASALAGLSATETYAYTGGPGAYVLSTITRS